MKEKTMYIGVDIGNAATKSYHTALLSGYTSHDVLPFGATDYLLKDNKYLLPVLTEGDIFRFERDKTLDDRWTNLLLMSISKEIIHRIKSTADTQEEISRITVVNLGLGLPPADMVALRTKTEEYYTNIFKDGVRYVWNGYEFNYKVGKVRVYPQNVSALLVYEPPKKEKEEKSLPVSRRYQICYGVDIGGYTLDVARTINYGRNDAGFATSYKYGINVFCSRVAKRIRNTYAFEISKEDIINVLMGKLDSVFLSEDIISIVREEARSFVHEFMGVLENDSGIDFRNSFVVFMGGSCKLFKQFIVKMKNMEHYAFIPNQRINAEGFEKLLIAEMRREAMEG